MNLELSDKEGSHLCVKTNKLGFGVFASNVSEMHVNNLASLKVLVIEVAKSELALSHGRQEFIFLDLSV